MRLHTRTASSFTALMLMSLVLAGCGDSAPPLGGELEGPWTGPHGLVIEFQGTTARVISFGSSPLGTNPTVFAEGDAFITDVSCGGDWCGAKIVSPFYADDVLQGLAEDDVVLQPLGRNELRVMPWTADSFSLIRGR